MVATLLGVNKSALVHDVEHQQWFELAWSQWTMCSVILRAYDESLLVHGGDYYFRLPSFWTRTLWALCLALSHWRLLSTRSCLAFNNLCVSWLVTRAGRHRVKKMDSVFFFVVLDLPSLHSAHCVVKLILCTTNVAVYPLALQRGY